MSNQCQFIPSNVSDILSPLAHVMFVTRITSAIAFLALT